MTDEPTDLATWLLEQIAEDEQGARAATAGPWSVDDRAYPEAITAEDGTSVVAGGRWGGEASVFDADADALHIAGWSPTRVLAECDAKQQIVECHREEVLPDGVPTGLCDVCLNWAWPCKTLRLLALPYADRPGYREEWRP